MEKGNYTTILAYCSRNVLSYLFFRFVLGQLQALFWQGKRGCKIIMLMNLFGALASILSW